MTGKKNKSSVSGFTCFTEEWLSKKRNMSFPQAIQFTGVIWHKMSPKEREPYNIRAKQVKNNKVEKETCTGVKISEIQQQERDKAEAERKMKLEIERVVRNVAGNPTDLANMTFCMIAANFFAKVSPGNLFIPAEISIAKFSLASGVHGVYHTYVKPKQEIRSLMFEAKHHSDSTHKLPLPPNAMGHDNYDTISEEITNFLCDKDGKIMPVYTLQDRISIVTSVLDNIMPGYEDDNAESLVRVSSLNHLFYVLKEATSELGELPKQSSYVTDAYLDRDYFEYQINIACKYHEEIDRSKWCTTSCVTRWGYMFADYMCNDIGIKMKRGRHMPLDARINEEYEDEEETKLEEEEEEVDYVNMGAMSIAAQQGYKKQSKNKTLSESDYDIKSDVKAEYKAQKRHDNTTITSFATHDLDDSDDMNPWETVSKRGRSTNASKLYDHNVTSASTAGNSTLISNPNRGWGRGKLLLQSLTKPK